MTSIVLQEQATIFVDPALVDGLLPGDRFMINIIVTGATEVKAWEIELSFAKYMNVLAFVEAIEGDFLMMAGDETYFTYYIDAFDSLVKAACVILGQVPGVSGSGILTTIVFDVVGGGESPLDLHDTMLLDPSGVELPHSTVDGSYMGKAPYSTFTYSPANPVAEEDVTFNASESYDPDGFIADFSWNFGDGSTANVTSPITSHMFSTSGNYLVSLTAVDNDGFNSTKTTLIGVAPPPLPPPQYCTPDFTKPPVAGYQDTSEYMMGSIAVGIILPESTGPAYSWSDFEVLQTIEGIRGAMDWWKSQNPNANLSFAFDTHIRIPTTYEPIQMPEWEDFIWIDEVMSHLNYTFGSAWDKVAQYNNDIRNRLDTDWAFTIFVCDSDENVNMGNFADSGYAHAFLGGPWITMSRFSIYAWNAESYHIVVPAHEMGHIFYATDEYDYIRSNSGYLNAQDNDGSFGIMNQNDFFASDTTKLQIGWRDYDEDGILDIMDTCPAVKLDDFILPIIGSEHQFSGAAVEMPHQNLNPFGQRNNISINEVILVEYSVDDGSWVTASPLDGAFDEALEEFTFTASFPTSGTHSLKVRASNSVGNSQELDLYVENKAPPPVALFEYSPSIPIAGEPVSFDGSDSYDPNSGEVSYSWDFGDGTSASETDPFISYVYTEPGTFIATLTVTNDLGQTGKTQRTIKVKVKSTISVSANPNPVIMGSSTTISGLILPERTGAVVTIQWRLHPWHDWTFLAFVTTNQNGEYQLVWTPQEVGSIEINASWAGDDITLQAETTMALIVALPSPKIEIDPTSGLVGTKVTVKGHDFAYATSVYLTFDDQLLGIIFPDQDGRFNATLSVLLSEVGPHTLKATAIAYYTTELVAEATFIVVEATLLDVDVDVGSIYFKQETAEFFVQTTLKGALTNATLLKATLYLPDGATQTLQFQQIATGLYRIRYEIAGKGSMTGSYTLTVEATYVEEYLTAEGTAIKTFTVKPTWERELPKIGALSLACVGLISAAIILWQKEKKKTL